MPLELIQLAVRLHEDVLSDVFGVFAILGDVLGDAKDLAVILAHQFFEGGCVAVARSVYQRYVGVDLFYSGLFDDGWHLLVAVYFRR